jgi:hypothetical protein
MRSRRPELSKLVGLAFVAVLILQLLSGSLSGRAQDATPIADSDANKALVLRFLDEVWNEGNTDVAYEVLAPDFTWWLSTGEIYLIGPDAFKREADAVRAAIDEVGLTFDIVLAEGEFVAVRYTFLGILPQGDGTPQAADAAPEELCRGNAIYRVEDGKIAELWDESVSCSS